MHRHRSPRRSRTSPNKPEGHPQPRRRAMHRFAAPALAGAAVFGAVAAGAAVVSPLVAADTDLAGAAFSPSNVAATEPATTPAAPPLAAPAPEQPAGDVQALAKGVALAEERARVQAEKAAAEKAAEEKAAEEKAAEEAAAEEAAAQEAAEAESAPEQSGSGGSCESSGFDGVAPHVAEAGHHLQQKFGVEDVHGVAERSNSTSDHPRGYALDFMVDESTGDALAAYAEENTEALGIKYILWQVEDHYDHVHLSFTDEPGSGLPC